MTVVVVCVVLGGSDSGGLLPGPEDSACGMRELIMCAVGEADEELILLPGPDDSA